MEGRQLSKGACRVSMICIPDCANLSGLVLEDSSVCIGVCANTGMLRVGTTKDELGVEEVKK